MEAEHEVDVAGHLDGVPVSPAQLASWVRLALTAAPGASSVGVQVVDAQTIQALNAQYRDRDKPTNVLSFPAEVPAPLPVRPLGDVLVCAEVVAEEARAGAIEPAAHWAHMVIHGTLHLLGYDHESDEEATVMEARETLLLASAGFEDPYRTRHEDP
ncbi:MAG: rRNA maturation RNase YbeY [Pseudomonadota bacterium]